MRTFILATMAASAFGDDAHGHQPYSRDYYAAHACEHAVEDLQHRLDHIIANDFTQNKNLGEYEGTVEPYENQLTPIDEKACQNDARTAQNAQTDIDQQTTIHYLQAKQAALSGQIGSLK